MRSLWAVGLIVVAWALAGCGHQGWCNCQGSSCSCRYIPFVDDPGYGLPEGGGVFHDHLRVNGQSDQTSIVAYQFTAPTPIFTRFPAPPQNGQGLYGDCVDERYQGAQTWPFAPLTGAGYIALDPVSVSGPGIPGALSLAKQTPMTASWTERHIDLGYGASGDGSLSQPGAAYTITFGGENATMTYHMPDAYTPPLGIGGAATVVIPSHADLVYTWNAPPQSRDPGTTTPTTHFNFTLFVDPTSTATIQFICWPDVDGHQRVPQTVLQALATNGIIVNADMTTYLAAQMLPDNMDHSIPLIATYLSASPYQLQ